MKRCLSAFWDFAHEVWRQPEARAQLLDAQDRLGCSVIYLLFTKWYPHPISATTRAQLEQESLRWQRETTGRIRALRRRLKASGQWPEGYQALLNLEQVSERLEATVLLYYSDISLSENCP